MSLVICAPPTAAAVVAAFERCSRHAALVTIDEADLLELAIADGVSAIADGASAIADRSSAIADGAVDLGEGASAVADGATGGRQRFCTFHTSGTTAAPKPVHTSYAEFAAFVVAAAAPYRLTSVSRVFIATSPILIHPLASHSPRSRSAPPCASRHGSSHCSGWRRASS